MTKKYTEVIKNLHVFETAKTKLKHCRGDDTGVMFSIAILKNCVITTCVLLCTCGYSKVQSQSLAHWSRKLFYLRKKMLP